MCRVGLLTVFGVFLVCGARAEVCGSIDVRNSVSQLNKLENCTEIAGTLFIVLIEKTKSEADFEPYVFPKLQKVSEYVVIYKVTHLTSLGKLFPNLRLIRGLNLLVEYSLVLYNLPNLLEIGTTKLSYIGRGYVKLGRVPKLCHPDNIDWSRIGKNTVAVYQPYSKDCPPCPSDCNGYCWNDYSCQIFTDDCHEECLGCTKNHSNAHCEVCKNFDDNGVCVPECPPDKYALHYLGKCVTKEECLTSNKPTKALNKITWFIHSRECLNECPEETHFNNITKDCQPCYNKCVKWCRGNKLMSEISVQTMRGCTHINGSLAIQSLMGPLQKTSLYKYLKHVRYIRDYLLISRNDGIEDLRFLPALREIGGVKLYANKSLMVFENGNLKSLWSANVSLVIRNGNIGFHDNEQLCLSKIEKFAQQIGIKYTENDVSQYSNGADCAESIDTKLQVMIAQYRTDGVTITWQNRSENQILYYTVYYTNSPSVIQSDPDVCSKDGWLSFSTSNTSAQLTDLETFQMYYYYIKMYHKNLTITRTRERFFTTLADDPRPPLNFKAIALNSTTVLLKWDRPEETYGTLNDYRISIYKEHQNFDIIKYRDYCLNPFTSEGAKEDPWDSEPPKLDPKVRNQLHYQLGPPDKIFPEPKCDVINVETNFRLEDDVWLNLCDEKSQSKYGIDDCKNYYYDLLQKNRSLVRRRSIEYTQYYAINVNANTTVYTVTNLEPFSLYVFYIMACNEENYGKPLCSAVLQTVAKTNKNEQNDIAQIDIQHISNLDLRVSWQPPVKPNGAVLAYHLYYGKHKEHLKNQKTCFGPHTTETNLTLRPGYYYLSIQTVSLAGPTTYVTTLEVALSDTHIGPAWIAIIILLVIIASVFSFCAFHYVKSRKNGNLRMIAHVNPDYHCVAYRNDEWQMDRDDIEIGSLIGQGSFGMVYFGRIKSRNLECAIKTVREESSEHLVARFLDEAENMKGFTEGPHVVKLYGLVTRSSPPMVAMELMERGDLKKYLIKMRSLTTIVSSNEIYRMAIEIADGLAYLASRKFVHRDLAARNCMVAMDRTVKIGDFGLTRDIYLHDYYKQGTGHALLPVRWMAPESIADGVYTYDTDIWSYGIVLWEIVTLAEQPYPGLSNEHVRQHILDQGKPDRPKACPNLLWEIMKTCWEWHPMKRPTCFQIIERLQDNVSENFKAISFYHSERGQNHIMKHCNDRLQTVPAMVSSKNLMIEELTVSETDPLNPDDEDVDITTVKLVPDPDYVLPSSPEKPHSIEYVNVIIHETVQQETPSDEETEETQF